MQYLCGLNTGAAIHKRNVNAKLASIQADHDHELAMMRIQNQTAESAANIHNMNLDMLMMQQVQIMQQQQQRIAQLEQALAQTQQALKKEKAESDHWLERYDNAVGNVLILNEVLKKHHIPKPPLSRYDSNLKKYVTS